jgi:NTP pyrophosphatase (non-canonical NTP hydrolase)
MAIEECSELITVILHHRRERATTAQLAEEVADVLIMAQQARQMTDPALVDLYIKKKLDRLERRVTAGELKRKEGLEPGPNDMQGGG